MADILMTLGAHTLGGSAAVVLLALAGRGGRARMGARWRCLAWLLLCLRLAVPLPLLPRLQTALSPIRLPAPPDTVLYAPPASPASPAPPHSGGADSSPGRSPSPGRPSSEGAASSPPQAPQAAERRPLSLVQLLFLLWLAGAGIMLLALLAAHLRFLAYLRRWAVPAQAPELLRAYNRTGDELGLARRPRLLLCPGLETPMLAGVLRPVLLLPEAPPEGPALEHIFLHELSHCLRGDLGRKALAMWVNALHWFNPLMWRMVRLMERDTELACDEAALRHLPPEEHAAYGRTVLDAVEKRRPL